MIYVVDENDKILNRCDAWELDAPFKMAKWAEANGYEVDSTEITFLGDMVIRVSK